jgi:hypothetical protein
LASWLCSFPASWLLELCSILKICCSYRANNMGNTGKHDSKKRKARSNIKQQKQRQVS